MRKRSVSGIKTVPVGALVGAPGGDGPDAEPAVIGKAATPLKFKLVNGGVVLEADAPDVERPAAAAIAASALVAALAAGNCPALTINEGREVDASEEIPDEPGIESCCIKLGVSIADEAKLPRPIGGGEAIAEKSSCWLFGGPIALSGGVGSLIAATAV